VASKRTPLHATHIAAGARLVDFAGWDMPLQYTSVRDEQRAVREGAAVFDVSHMGRLLIRGAGAEGFLQHVVTGDVSRVAGGQALYTLLCRPDGGVIDDLVVYRGTPWRAVVNAATHDGDVAWLRQHAPDGVAVEDVSDESALIALQGPRAQALLASELPELAGPGRRLEIDLDSIPFFGWVELDLAGGPAAISRTGYTGEDGFELWIPAAAAAAVWDRLTAAGAVPAGLATRDVCRLEAALRLYGADMDERTNPYQAGLGWTVKLDKGDFLGAGALRAVKERGPDRRLIGVEVEGRTIPRHGAAVRLAAADGGTSEGGDVVGVVTSGTYSFWLRKGIALASVDAAHAAKGTRLAVESRGAAAPAVVVGLPFYRGSARPTAR
jgi:aminomethyltransferase